MRRRTWLQTVVGGSALEMISGANSATPQESSVKSTNSDDSSTNDDVVRLGIIGDSHYNEVGGRKEITAGTDIKQRWDTIINDFNEWGATAVLVTGDLTDRKSCPNIDTYDQWTQTAMDYLERTGGRDGNGLNMPAYYTLGDHEYSYYGDGYFGPYGYGSRTDSYYKAAADSVDIVVVTDVSTSSDWDAPQSIGQEQLDWLKTTLYENSRPKIVLTHIPPFDAASGPFGKDGVTDGDEFVRIVESCPSVVTVIYGHVHHNDEFDRHRSQRSGWMHVTSPHQLMGNASVTPYAKLTTGSDGGGVVEANYTKAETGYPDTWGFVGNEHRQENTSQTQLSGLSVKQVEEIPSDVNVNGGNTALYSKPGGGVYKRAYGGGERGLVAAIRDGKGGPNLAIERGTTEFDDPGTPNDGSWDTSTTSREVVEFDHGFASKPVVVFPSSTHPGGVVERGRLTKDSVELIWRFYASFDSAATTVRWLAVGKPV